MAETKGYEAITIRYDKNNAPFAFLNVYLEASSPYATKKSSINVKAFIDTGAGMSGISQNLALELGLISKNTEAMSFGGGPKESNIYFLDVILPHNIVFHKVKTVEIHDSPVRDFVVGMDILSKIDFAITHEGDNMYLSYRHPPAENLIHFHRQPVDYASPPPYSWAL